MISDPHFLVLNRALIYHQNAFLTLKFWRILEDSYYLYNRAQYLYYQNEYLD